MLDVCRCTTGRMGLSQQAKMSDTHSCRLLPSVSACLMCGGELPVSPAAWAPAKTA